MAASAVDMELLTFSADKPQISDDAEENQMDIAAEDCDNEPDSLNRNDYCGSLASIQGDVCRICHCEAEPGVAPLISPCACAGTLRYVHQSCLQQWIKSVNCKSCELCKVDFHMTTSVKPFRTWQKLEMTKVERRKIFCSVTFHVIAITCVVWSLYVLIDRTSEEVRSGVLEWPFWTKLIVVAIGFAGGIVFMYVQCRMYLQLCRRWRAYNRVIYVQDCGSAEPSTSGARMLPIQSKSKDLENHSHRTEQVVLPADLPSNEIFHVIDDDNADQLPHSLRTQ